MSLHPAAQILDQGVERQQGARGEEDRGQAKGEEARRGEELLPDVNLMLSQQESVVNSTTGFQH